MSLNELPKIKESEIVYDCFFRIRRDLLQLPNKKEYSYYSLVTKPIAVMILASTDEGKYVINREYRHPTQTILLGCPGGVKDEGETILDCAERELLEETGYTASSFKILGEAFPFPGVTSQKVFYVRAFQAKQTKQQSLDSAEYIETALFTKEELYQQIKSGIAVDGLLLSALFFNCLQE